PNGGAPQDCWLERWRTEAIVSGARALDALRDGVTEAITKLGTGFLSNPANQGLRDRLARGELALDDYHRALLRLVYRLLFLFVSEDRDALLDPGATPEARARYEEFFSTARLRAGARRRRGSRHSDRWQALVLVTDGLGSSEGLPELGLSGLGGLFESGDLLSGLKLRNEDLLAAVRSLSTVSGGKGPRRVVDYRNLGAEELGSVYESLLEYAPRHDPQAHTFTLELVAGNERKTTGSYYTPSSLIEALLDATLDPLLDEAQSSDRPVEALLAVTVCDPACGSGHFLVAAARRIAKRLAFIETEDVEPPPEAVSAALRRVVRRCIYGVDVNPLAAELAKVSLWLEALEPGRPLSFLDAQIKVGNSLLGVTPKLLGDGLPDAAFKAIEGDDRKFAAALAKRNRTEQAGQTDLLGEAGIRVANTSLAAATLEFAAAEESSVAEVEARTRRYRELQEDPELLRARTVADAWCAAFVWRKHPDAPEAITQAVLERLDARPEVVPAQTRAEIERLAARYRFFHWHLEFPHIFSVPEVPGPEVDERTGWAGGFSCVLGNPPWDQVQLDAREFFSSSDPDIARAPTMSARMRAIQVLKTSDPHLFAAYGAAQRHVDGLKHFVHSSGCFPLTSFGRLNTYSLFAERKRTLISNHGRVATILPTGIATDSFNQYFFRDVVESSSLASLFDFENRTPLFATVDSRFKFCLLSLTGRDIRETAAEFAFFLRDPADLSRPGVRFELKPDEITLLNPNTGTCPVFRSRRDAEITLDIYRRVPVLLKEGDPEGNPWGISFMLMFMMNTDSHRFRIRAELEEAGWRLEGNVFVRAGERMLPLIEAKMLHHYDHRWATYERDGSTRDVTVAEKQDPNFVSLPRYWVPAKDVAQRLSGRWDKPRLMGWRDITNSTNERTTIASSFPLAAVGNNLPLMFASKAGADLAACLQSNMSSLVMDFTARLKMGGTHMNFFVYQQLPVLTPDRFRFSEAWPGLVTWMAKHVVELSYTAHDMDPFASDLGDDGPPFIWDDERRGLLRAELDACYFHLYGVERDDVSYILDTFPIIKRKDEKSFGEFRTKRLILESYDVMAAAIAAGEPYKTILDPPPGHGPRHPARSI
ncbi:MAG: Eco57I restriction-modification methylase domain-containing protein, partial [Actinomycetota bacterium]